MVIWTGWGFLVLVILLGASLGTELVTEALMGDDQFYQRAAWPLALAFALAGIATWYVGIWLRRRGARVVIDKTTGQELTIGGSHTLFFVPMHYWGIVLLALAVLPFITR